MTEPLFSSVNQAITVLLGITAGLSRLLVWLVIGTGHLAVAVLALAALWWFQVTPTELMDALRSTARTTPVAVLSVAGVSVLTLLGGYWKLAKWAHRKAGSSWILGYVTKGL